MAEKLKFLTHPKRTSACKNAKGRTTSLARLPLILHFLSRSTICSRSGNGAGAERPITALFSKMSRCAYSRKLKRRGARRAFFGF